MFRAQVLIIRRPKLYYTVCGIITPIGGRPMHRLRESSLNHLVFRWMWNHVACRTSDEGKSCSTNQWCFMFENISKALYSIWSSCLSKHSMNSAAETRLFFQLISLLFASFCMLLFLLYFLVNIEDPEPPRRRERQMEEKTKMVVVGSTP